MIDSLLLNLFTASVSGIETREAGRKDSSGNRSRNESRGWIWGKVSVPLEAASAVSSEGASVGASVT